MPDRATLIARHRHHRAQLERHPARTLALALAAAALCANACAGAPRAIAADVFGIPAPTEAPR